MDKVTHVGRNGLPIPIGQPMPEEVLSEDFDYSKYVEDQLSDLSDEELDDLLYSKREHLEPLKGDELTFFNNYLEAIAAIQTIYEKDLKNGSVSIDYNKAMKEIAQKYFNALQNQIKYRLKRQNTIKRLTFKRKKHTSALKKINRQKPSFQANSDERIQAFLNGKIPLGKLYYYDLNRALQNEVYSRHKRNLERYRKHLLSKLINYEGIYDKPIEELNFQGKSK